jgi:anti-sigma factor (TIGR02949 family)
MHEDCQDCFDRISEFMDGETDECTCERIRAHLKNSPKCQNCLESLRKTVTLCKEGSNEKVPPDVRARIRALINMRLRTLIDMCSSRM